MACLDLTKMGKCRTSLSDIPSEGLRQVVNDIRWARRQPGVSIDMDYWLRLTGRGRARQCQVCAAGAVMLRRLWHPDEVPPSSETQADVFETVPPEIDDKLSAVDFLRRGDVLGFVQRWLHRSDIFNGTHGLTSRQRMCIARFQSKWNYTGPIDAAGMRAFYQQCLKLAGALKKVGL